MIEFPCHTIESAPDAARPVLEVGEKAFGMLPNLFRKMAESPALLESYWQLNQIFAGSSLNPVEQQVVLLSVSVANRCGYCVGAHSALADMTGVPAEVTEALRSGEPIADSRLEALRHFTRTLVEQRGWAPEAKTGLFWMPVTPRPRYWRWCWVWG